MKNMGALVSIIALLISGLLWTGTLQTKVFRNEKDIEKMECRVEAHYNLLNQKIDKLLFIVSQRN